MNTVEEFRNGIMQFIRYSMPSEYLMCLESADFVSFDQFIDYVMLEIIKEAHYKVADKHSMRYYLRDVEDDYYNAERMKYSRIQSFAREYRTKELERRKNFNKAYLELSPKDMSSIKDKTNGYEFTELQFYELSNMQNTGLIKSLVEKRFMDSKKVSTQKAIELFAEYDRWMSSLVLSENSTDKEVIFNSLAAFIFEWKYPVEYVYKIATYMDENDISEFDLNKIGVLCADVTFFSLVTGKISTHSRMVKERIENVKYFYEWTEDLLDTELFIWYEFVNLKSYIILNMTMNDVNIVDKFIELTCQEEWAEFLRRYNIFSMYEPNKKWSKRKIKYIRRIFEGLFVY